MFVDQRLGQLSGGFFPSLFHCGVNFDDTFSCLDKVWLIAGLRLERCFPRGCSNIRHKTSKQRVCIKRLQYLIVALLLLFHCSKNVISKAIFLFFTVIIFIGFIIIFGITLPLVKIAKIVILIIIFFISEFVLVLIVIFFFDELGLVLLCIDSVRRSRCYIHIASFLLEGIFPKITATVLPAAIRCDNLARLLDRPQIKQISHSASLLLARLLFTTKPDKVVLVVICLIEIAKIAKTVIIVITILILSLDLWLSRSVPEIPKTIIVVVIINFAWLRQRSGSWG